MRWISDRVCDDYRTDVSRTRSRGGQCWTVQIGEKTPTVGKVGAFRFDDRRGSSRSGSQPPGPFLGVQAVRDARVSVEGRTSEIETGEEAVVIDQNHAGGDQRP
jgi:hypothetical protein